MIYVKEKGWGERKGGDCSKQGKHSLKDLKVRKSLAGSWMCKTAGVAGTECFQGRQHKKGGEVSWGRSCMALLAVFRNLDKATRGMELPLNEMGKLEK